MAIDPHSDPKFSTLCVHGGETLDADVAAIADQLLVGMEEVVLLPVGVDEVVAQLVATVGRAAVDVSADGGVVILGDHQAVVAAKAAIDEIAVVIDVVAGGKKHSLEIILRHVAAQLVEAGLPRRCSGLHLIELTVEFLEDAHQVAVFAGIQRADQATFPFQGLGREFVVERKSGG